LLRFEAGEAPQPAHFQDRFPKHAEALALQFELEANLRTEPETISSLARAAAAAAATPEVPGYEILGELGRGGMGIVYRARQVRLGRVVALKMVLAGAMAAPADVERFRAEALAAARLDHPHIVPIYEVGEHQRLPYCSMKYIKGRSLAQHLGSLAADVRSAVRLVAQVARAVHHAHQRGIIHRDLKPGNILLSFSGDAESLEGGAAAAALPSEKTSPKFLLDGARTPAGVGGSEDSASRPSPCGPHVTDLAWPSGPTATVR
jgi:serine/threonine-protein kinase